MDERYIQEQIDHAHGRISELSARHERHLMWVWVVVILTGFGLLYALNRTIETVLS